MIWLIIVGTVFILSVVGTCIYGYIDEQVENLSISRNEAIDAYFKEEDRHYRDNKGTFRLTEKGKALFEQKEMACKAYDKWFYRQNEDAQFWCGALGIISAVIIIIILIVCGCNHASWNVEHTLADIEETRTLIQDKVDYIDKLYLESEGANSREYQEARTQATQMAVEVRGEIAEFNKMINEYIASRKSPWTNIFIPKEYTKIEKINLE